uniref:Uncharacterized protein n=1 Tax=Rhizophora mucronata TaxID=61149 RepID=A0A2P2P213_RHIMU
MQIEELPQSPHKLYIRKIFHQCRPIYGNISILNANLQLHYSIV